MGKVRVYIEDTLESWNDMTPEEREEMFRKASSQKVKEVLEKGIPEKMKIKKQTTSSTGK